MSCILDGCKSLISLPDISSWNTNNVINMSYMFSECNSLKSLPNISIWKNNNVTNMSGTPIKQTTHKNNIIGIPIRNVR